MQDEKRYMFLKPEEILRAGDEIDTRIKGIGWKPIEGLIGDRVGNHGLFFRRPLPTSEHGETFKKTLDKLIEELADTSGVPEMEFAHSNETFDLYKAKLAGA